MKAVRIVLAIVGAAVVVLIAAAIVLVATFDANDYKDEITAFVQERTGRTLTVGNEIELSLFPWFAVETGGVSLSDDPAFGQRSFVEIDDLSARVRVWPLLSRRVEIGRVIFDGVSINLGIDANGRGNWASLTGSIAPDESAGPAETTATDGPERPVEQLAIEGIELRDARLMWHDANGEVRYIVRDLSLSTGAINDSEPVALDIALSVLDVASQFEAALSLDTLARIRPVPELSDLSGNVRLRDAGGMERVTASFEAGRLDLDDGLLRLSPASLSARLTQPPVGASPLDLTASLAALEFESGREHLALNGLQIRSGTVIVASTLSGTSIRSAPALRGNVSVEGASLGELMRLLDLSLPASVDPGVLADAGAFAAGGDFELGLAPLSLQLPAFSLRAVDASATGRFALADDGSITARIELPAFRPGAGLRELAAAWLPPDIETNAIGSVGASAALRVPAGRDRIAIEDLGVSLDGARLTGDVNVLDPGGPLRVEGALQVAGIDNRLLRALAGDRLPERLAATSIGELRATADFDYSAATERLALESLALSAYGLSGTGRLTIDGAGRALRVAGSASLAQFSPRDLLARFDLPVPQSADPGALASAEIAASFETTADDGRFRDIVVLLDGSRITGSFSVENFADPAYQFALSADRLDADRYLPQRAEDTGTDVQSDNLDQADDAVLGEMRLANDALTATRISGQASVGRLTIGGMLFEDLSTSLAIGDGRAELGSVQTRLYGGTFAGRFLVDASGDVAAVQLAGNADSLAMRPLLEAMLGDANLSGTGTFALDLTGRGNTVNEALQGTSGTMSVAFRDGQLRGINVGRELCTAINRANQLPAPPAAEDATRFGVIRASATISDGIASTSDLYATTGYLDLTGRGSIRLADQWLDTNYVTRLMGPIDLPGCERLNSRIDNSIPIGFRLAGQLPDPEFSFDIRQLLEDWARRELRNRVEDAVIDRLRESLF